MLKDDLKNEIKNTIVRYLPPDNGYRIFIFGSRALGINMKWSDIDVGILGNKKIPGHILIEIEEDLENSRIPFKIDIVDFQTISEQFRKLALKKAIYL